MIPLNRNQQQCACVVWFYNCWSSICQKLILAAGSLTNKDKVAPVTSGEQEAQQMKDDEVFTSTKGENMADVGGATQQGESARHGQLQNTQGRNDLKACCLSLGPKSWQLCFWSTDFAL